MNAAQVTAVAAALDRAGIRVRRGVRTGGNLSGWEPVHATQAVAAWLQKGWVVVVEDDGATGCRDGGAQVLELFRERGTRPTGKPLNEESK